MANSSGIVDKNAANKTKGKHIHNYSTFDRSLSYRFYNTHRFGDYTPSFVMEGVPKDEIALNSLDRLDSLSLKAPFKGSIRKIKESFMVPNMAILPFQWDRIYAQNSNGDDVPADANCVLINFPTLFSQLFSSCITAIRGLTVSSSGDLLQFLNAAVRTMVLGEYVYSSGSLLNVLGYKASAQFHYQRTVDGRSFVENFDYWFDETARFIFDGIAYVWVVEPIGSTTRTHYIAVDLNSQNPGRLTYEDFRSIFELFRENPLCYFSQVGILPSTTLSAVTTRISSMIQASYGYFSISSISFVLPQSSYTGDPADVTSLNPNVLNLSRILAYQLVCHHFYTNSSIDFIYSADLFRQYVDFLNRSSLGANYQNNFNFSWNGINLLYDFLSGRFLIRSLGLFNSVYSQPLVNSIHLSSVHTSLAVWAALFSFRKSLRYGDYFTASRPRPLAPINTDVSVNNGMVSVVDITRNIQAQRFANAVMRSRSKIEEYVKSLFGAAPQPDYHNPFFLTRQEEIIFGDYVQNTVDNQTVPNSRSANFAGNLSRHTFTFHNDDNHPCIYLQIVSYDTPRAYTRSVERQLLHVDRFDMFNPDFQYIGDQAVYGIELGYSSQGAQMPNIFSYQSRDMEYKQRYDQASGGFASGSLPGWAFTDERLRSLYFSQISPDFIRSRNTDIDYLYVSLTGLSLGNYFHFTVVTDNNVRAKRAMAVDPQILA